MNDQIQINELAILPLEVAHSAAIITLPFHHKDPFDRLLIAQSLVETIPIVSADVIFDAYGVTRLW
jgi:PIN domain nuclease of toxin-antitoxin system